MNALNHDLIVKTIDWPDEAATQTFARALARALTRKLESGPKAAHALILLQGDLGVGKTTFVRYLLAALGVKGRVKSPTYAVVEPYTLQRGLSSEVNIWHFDFYRFNDPREWEEAGFRDIFASPGLKLVEWPDKAGKYLPQADLTLAIDLLAIDTLAGDTRQVTLTARTATGKALLK